MVGAGAYSALDAGVAGLLIHIKTSLTVDALSMDCRGRIILYQNDSFSIFLKVLGSKAPDPRAEYPQPEG